MTKTLKELLQFGIIVIDKPTGPTSFEVDVFVKGQLALTKTSHFGTLDPTVSGVLPIALNRACKVAQFFSTQDKTYVGIMRLHEEVSDSTLQKTIKQFIGKINQLPPVRSNVKRETREREIKTFAILEREGMDILFETEVQAGTYIRKLIHDIGLVIGGAHMLELRRTKASIFDESNLVTLYDFEKAVNLYKKGDDAPLRTMIISADEALRKSMPVVQVKQYTEKLLTGKPIMKGDLETIPDEGVFSVFDKKQLIGVYRTVNEGVIIARPEFVLN